MSRTDFSLDFLDCPPALLDAALTLIYSTHPHSDRDELVHDARRTLTLDSGLSIRIALRDGTVLAALLFECRGRTAALWPPCVSSLLESPQQIGAKLVAETLSFLRARGIQLVQCLPPNAHASPLDQNLTLGGMHFVTELLSMRYSQDSDLAPQHETPFLWQALNADNRDQFRDTVAKCLLDTRDLPELQTVQSADDLLEPFQLIERERTIALLGSHGSLPAAIVMLVDDGDRAAIDVRFLGLIPSMRGRGLGRFIVDYALRTAQARQPNVELAVDIRNTPAIRLYERAGFRRFERRPLYLAMFPHDSSDHESDAYP